MRHNRNQNAVNVPVSGDPVGDCMTETWVPRVHKQSGVFLHSRCPLPTALGPILPWLSAGMTQYIVH